MTPNPEQSERLLALAERCEAAEGPDREIDRAIMEELSLKPDYAADWGPRDNCRPAPFTYTASLDAAMTLIPAQYRLGTLMEFDGEGRWGAKLFNRGKPGGLPAAGGASAPLALCVACLRARAGDGA